MPNVDVSMHDGCAHRDAIVADEPLHDGVLPFLGAVAERKLATTGATRMAKTSAPIRAKLTVHAIGLKSRPSTACKVKMGR